MVRFYSIEQHDEMLGLCRVWRGSAFSPDKFDGRYPVPVFGPASRALCQQFVDLLVNDEVGFEFAARDRLLQTEMVV